MLLVNDVEKKMAEEPKKISFGFTKINTPVISLQKKQEKEIQFIDCLEGNSIKLLNGAEKDKGPLVIPLRNGNVLRDNMIEVLKARKENKHSSDKQKNVKSTTNKDESDAGETNKPLTLDELAAKEILEDLKKIDETEETQEVLTIPQTEAIKVSEKESSLEDYDNMPVNQFGLAVLRGMGWAPDKGIGKNAQIVQPVNPVLRPKGMGLGADKVIQVPKTKSNEELVMKKGAFLNIISGPHKGFYGKIEGFDELPGRVIVRLTLRNIVISISENLIQLVTSSEYNKNSKILNLNEYNNFLDKKPTVGSSETVRKNAHEHKKNVNINYKKNDKYSSDDEIKPKKESKNVEYYKSKDKKKSTYSLNERHRKHKYTSDSDSESRINHKYDSHKSRNNRNKSTKHSKERIMETDSSDNDSSVERKKSKSKKHRKHSSRHRSRSRSRSKSVSRKKKKHHRSRS